MASASNYFPHYKLTKLIKAGTTATSDALLALVAGAKLVQLRSESVKISINGGDQVTYKYGDEQALIAGDTWYFVNDTEIAIGVIVNLLP